MAYKNTYNDWLVYIKICNIAALLKDTLSFNLQPICLYSHIDKSIKKWPIVNKYNAVVLVNLAFQVKSKFHSIMGSSLSFFFTLQELYFLEKDIYKEMVQEMSYSLQ